MNNTHLVCALLMQAASASAQLSDVVLSPDRTELTFSVNGRATKAPLTHDRQEGFMGPAVSADGRTIGWLALTTNCCTSYPLPTALVFYRDGKAWAALTEATPIWRWELDRDGKTVIYAVHPPHGGYVVQYFKRHVPSGKLLERRTCDPEVPAEASGKALPAWVKRVASMCPVD
jgi:hypothetical protein